MPLTPRQALVLRKLHQVVYRKKKTGDFAYFLAKEDVTSNVISLLSQRMLVKESNGYRLRLTDQAACLVEPTTANALLLQR